MSYSWNTFKETHISFIKQKTTILHSLELLNEFSLFQRNYRHFKWLHLPQAKHLLSPATTCKTFSLLLLHPYHHFYDTLHPTQQMGGTNEGRILKYYEWVKNFQDAFLSCNTFRPPLFFGNSSCGHNEWIMWGRTTTKSYSTGLLTGARGVCVCVCAWKTCLLRLIWRELAKAYYIYTPLAVLLFMVLEEVCCCCFLSLVWSAKWCGLVMELRVGVGLGNNVVFVLCPWGPIKVKACCGTFFVKCKSVCVCVTVAFGPGYKTLKLWTHSVTYLR